MQNELGLVILKLGTQHHFDDLAFFTVAENPGQHSRTLHWYNRADVEVLQHVVPHGSIPDTLPSRLLQPSSSSSPYTVTFCEENEQGTTILHKFVRRGRPHPPLYYTPLYIFPGKKETEDFQGRVRARQFLQDFDTHIISRAKRRAFAKWAELSRAQPLKLWRRSATNCIATFTLFAHLSSVDFSRHFELDIRWFKHEATLQSTTKILLAFNGRRDLESKEGAQHEKEDPRKRRKTSTVSSSILHRRDTSIESDMPRALTLHDLPLRVPDEEFSSWESIQIEFTNPGDAEKFASTCFDAKDPNITQGSDAIDQSTLRRGSRPVYGTGAASSTGSVSEKLSNPSSSTSPTIRPQHAVHVDMENDLKLGRAVQEETEEQQGATRSKSPRNPAARDWWRKFIYHRDRIFPHDGIVDSIKPVKIAVMDTGIDATNSFVKTSWQVGSQRSPDDRYRDFLNDTGTANNLTVEDNGYSSGSVQDLLKPLKARARDEPVDPTGHGTHVAGIVLQLVPHAILYVARILREDRKNYDDGTVGRANVRTAAKTLALAILYATEKWEVDVITLSIGFNRDLLDPPIVKIIRHALDYAKSRNVVVFAAASNSGNRDILAFPASEGQHMRLICVNSSNGDGRQSRFNPDPQEQVSLSILGEDVRSTWPQNLSWDEKDKTGATWKYDEGTSIATPILASVAALLIQFSRQYKPSSYAMLESPEGIYHMLRRMAGNPTREGFYDIVPWKEVFNSNYSTGIVQNIRQIIDQVMRNA